MHSEYMDASSTDMEHMEGLIKEHKDAKPTYNAKQLAQPQTIPFDRIQRTVTILQQRFRMRQSERESEKADSSAQSWMAIEHAKRQEELRQMQRV